MGRLADELGYTDYDYDDEYYDGEFEPEHQEVVDNLMERDD